MEVALDMLAPFVNEIEPVPKLSLDLYELPPPVKHFGFQIVGLVKVLKPANRFQQKPLLPRELTVLGLQDLSLIIALFFK
jgi:hypothetical protein